MTDSSAYDGQSAEELRLALQLPRLELRPTVTSTMDIAHALAAAGAPAGTLVLADAQTAGRGRGGKGWESAAGRGIWLTLIERPCARSTLEVLSIRAGIAAAAALQPLSDAPIGLKWPNDLYVRTGKLAGILVETHWRGATPEWVALGIGVNVRLPDTVGAAGSLRAAVTRVDALVVLIPALRSAAAATDECLTDRELAEYTSRDFVRGHWAEAPVAGQIRGVDRRGALIVATSAGEIPVRAGSLVLAGGAPVGN
ncbi:MAG: biotin--[acetyl-CoA-carboxylase] ligase [Gemmatimonadaceae bacterium]